VRRRYGAAHTVLVLVGSQMAAGLLSVGVLTLGDPGSFLLLVPSSTRAPLAASSLLRSHGPRGCRGEQCC
jgi:hypothetical protein